MIVTAHDADFGLLAYDIPYSSLVWQRRFFDFGEFQLQLPASVYDSSWRFVMSPERDEIGMVQRIEYSSEDGGSIIVSGLFYEAILDELCVYKRFRKTGSVDDLCRDLVRDYYNYNREKLKLSLDRYASGAGAKRERYAANFVGDQIGTKINAMLESRGLSQQITLVDGKPSWNVREGTDRSSTLTLSTAYGDLAQVSVVMDDSAYKNAVVIGYGGSYDDSTFPTDWFTVTRNHDTVTFDEMRNFFLDMEGQDIESVREVANTASVDQFGDYERVMDIDAVVTNYDAVGTIYDLGDTVHLVIDEIGLELDTRVVEITETFGRDGRNVHVGFGNKRITNMRRMMATWR